MVDHVTHAYDVGLRDSYLLIIGIAGRRRIKDIPEYLSRVLTTAIVVPGRRSY